MVEDVFSHLRLRSTLMQSPCLQKTESLSLESVEVRLFGPQQNWAEKVEKSDLPAGPVLDSAKHLPTSALGTWGINLSSVDPHTSPTKSTSDSHFKNKEPEA